MGCARHFVPGGLSVDAGAVPIPKAVEVGNLARMKAW